MWNNRVIKTKDERGNTLYGVYEVFYNASDEEIHSDNLLAAHTEEPITLGAFESYEDLLKSIYQIYTDVLRHSTLDEEAEWHGFDEVKDAKD